MSSFLAILRGICLGLIVGCTAMDDPGEPPWGDPDPNPDDVGGTTGLGPRVVVAVRGTAAVEFVSFEGADGAA